MMPRAGQTFVPDYTVRAVTDLVYFRISSALYQAARNATLIERAQRDALQALRKCSAVTCDGTYTDHTIMVNFILHAIRIPRISFVLPH